MKAIKSFLSTLLIMVFVALIFTSCNKTPMYPLIESIPCDDPNVVVDQNIINDFECQANTMLDNVEAVLNPDESGANTSRFVGKYIDPAAPWDALIIDYGTSMDLSTHNEFKIKVKTSVAGLLIVKLEGGTSNAAELSANITNTQNWVEYAFDFSDQIYQDHTKLVMFFNAGVDTDGTDEYYIDDLRFEATVDPCLNSIADLSILNDFDCQQNLIIPFVETVPTPNKSDVNSSKFAGKYIDGTGAWDAIKLEFASGLDLSTENFFNIKVLAPVTGIFKIRLYGGSFPLFEQDIEITKAGEWVDYTFDLSSQAESDHTKFVLFFNAGVATFGTDVYFMDDLNFQEKPDPCEDVLPNLSIINDFNCQQNSTILGDVAYSIVANPEISTANPSDAVLEITDNGTDAWDALIFDYGSPIDLTTKNYLKIKVLSTKAVPILAKIEGGTSVGKEVWGTIDVLNEWTEYTFDFSSQANENHNKVVFFFNGGETDGTATDVYYIDDIKFAPYDPCSGTPTDLSIINDFECQQNYSIPGLVVNSIVANPDPSGINTSPFVLEVTDVGTDPWDALLFVSDNTIDLSVKNQLKIKVLASRAVPFLAKLEGGTSPVNEVWGSIITVGEWAEIIFDFSSQASENHKTLVLFFNGGANDGTAADIYYIDDLKWE